jgi:hypothetical protein
MHVKQGSTLSYRLEFKSNNLPVDMSGITFSGQIRKTALSSTVQASWSFDTTDASQGVIIATLSGTDTAGLTTGESINNENSQFWYDMRYTASSEHVYFLEGPLTLIRRVTR